jgi:hypothetical protein
MAVFSPARLIQVLTTLVDRSLDTKAVSGDGSEHRTQGSGMSKHPHLELIGRDHDGKPRDDTP